MRGYGPSSYGDAFADVYDDWYAEVTDVEGTVELVTRLAARGRVIELGVGTGRIALPLAAAGCRVSGVDASAAMLDRCRAKPGSEAVELLLADMSTDLPPGPVDVVLATYNTFFNLVEHDAQQRCLALVRDRLAPGGSLLLETFVPVDDAPLGDVSARTVELDRVVLSVSRRDPDAQVVSGQLIELTEASGVRLRPWSIRYLTPSQLDEMASAAGLVLAGRWSDWRTTPFDPDGAHQVVRYVRAT